MIIDSIFAVQKQKPQFDKNVFCIILVKEMKNENKKVLAPTDLKLMLEAYL